MASKGCDNPRRFIADLGRSSLIVRNHNTINNIDSPASTKYFLWSKIYIDLSKIYVNLIFLLTPVLWKGGGMSASSPDLLASCCVEKDFSQLKRCLENKTKSFRK